MRPIDADEYVKEMERHKYVAEVGMKDAIDPNLDHEIFTEREYWNGVLGTFAEAMDVADNMPTVGGWVSVEDRMPENEEIVIGYTPCDGYMFIGFYRTYKSDTYEWSDWNIITSMRSTKKITKKVTHWMPLPPEPEVSE